ncbi:dimethylamine monooxygenase subunit DmmA family protein [Gordonia sp. OPL2]|uniref:dimethylamine monooxygenase subunit DmmA family protein n=1 Tax=Gordonia sp. OPL2 TaxID=2486274 RepID=UPI0016554249|nr:dimethylamine monooxygenase subunit DmmA family protein [Gordonia sp. OPL2]ROZ88582.1 hypothetical protein EEB19_21960 [Gordonia sp. OPL2]
MSQIAFSSIPTWARPGASADDTELPSNSGRSYLLLGVGDATGDGMRRWVQALPDGTALQAMTFDDTESAAQALRDELARARVGFRLVIVAPAGAALALRGVATSAGLEDDEIHVTTAGAGVIEIFCSHCGAITSTVAAVDDVVDCGGCDRHLLVYHHVSRRSGRYLGFMVDAEAPATAGGSLS